MNYLVTAASDLVQLWDRFLTAGDREAREELILAYLSLVKHTAGRMAIFFQGYYDLDELVSAGIPGLIDAVDRFNPERGVKFETFATIKIKGMIIDWVRSLSWVPRSIYSEARKVEQSLGDLEQQLGRSPDEYEIAAYLNLSLEQYRQLMDKIAPVALVSLDSIQQQDGVGRGLMAEAESNVVMDQIDQEETKQALTDGIAQLPAKEQLVVSLYYYNGLTLKEIGRVLDVSESRVSQLHTKAILCLKRFFKTRA